jgi:hypothetical protein
MELAGEDAEAFEEKMEAFEMREVQDNLDKSNNNKDSGNNMRDSNSINSNHQTLFDGYNGIGIHPMSVEAGDDYLLKHAKASTAAWKKETREFDDDDLSGNLSLKAGDRDRDSGCGRTSKKDLFEPLDLEINEWEQELLKRTGIKASRTSEINSRALKKSLESLEKTGSIDISKSHTQKSGPEMLEDVISNEEIFANINKAIDTLENSCEYTRKRSIYFLLINIFIIIIINFIFYYLII